MEITERWDNVYWLWLYQWSKVNRRHVEVPKHGSCVVVVLVNLAWWSIPLPSRLPWWICLPSSEIMCNFHVVENGLIGGRKAQNNGKFLVRGKQRWFCGVEESRNGVTHFSNRCKRYARSNVYEILRTKPVFSCAVRVTRKNTWLWRFFIQIGYPLPPFRYTIR